MTDLNIIELQDIITEAQLAAQAAAMDCLQNTWNSVDGGSCGFAWTIISQYQGKPIKGNTKIGKLLKACGITQNWQRKYEIWNPSGVGVQNIDIKERGAIAAAAVFNKYGFFAYSGSRLD